LSAQMTSTAFVPRLNVLVNAGAFDPYSTHHLRRMFDLAEQLEAYLGNEDMKYQVRCVDTSKPSADRFGVQSVLQTVAHGFQKSITTMRDQITRFIGADTSRVTGFHSESLSARLRFMARAARLLSNLLQWRRYTKERHGLGLLCGDILSDLLLPVARGGWEVGAGDALGKASSFTFFRCLCLRLALLHRSLQQFHRISFLSLFRYV
jgi:GC-rich sequence DNA-binding factor